MSIDSIRVLISVVIGLWAMVHFTCRASLLIPRPTPFYIKYATLACAGSGSWLFFGALFCGDYSDAALSLAFSLILFEALLWFDGFNDISGFYRNFYDKRREK